MKNVLIFGVESWHTATLNVPIKLQWFYLWRLLSLCFSRLVNVLVQILVQPLDTSKVHVIIRYFIWKKILFLQNKFHYAKGWNAEKLSWNRKLDSRDISRWTPNGAHDSCLRQKVHRCWLDDNRTQWTSLRCHGQLLIQAKSRKIWHDMWVRGNTGYIINISAQQQTANQSNCMKRLPRAYLLLLFRPWLMSCHLGSLV